MPLAAESDHFLRIVEDAVVGVVEMDPAGRMAYVNPQWCEMLGFGCDELLGHSVLEFTDPECVAMTRDAIARMREGAASVVLHKRYRRKDGSVLHARSSVSAIRAPDGGLVGLAAFVVDVSERVEALERANTAHKLLSEALAVGQMMAWEWNPATGAIVSSTDPAEFWGVPVDSVEAFLALVHPDDRARVGQAAEAALAGIAPYDLEYRVATADGTVRWVQTRGRVELDADARPLRLFGVTTDITTTKRAQAATRLLAEAGQTLGASLDYEATLTHLARVLVPDMADWYAVDLLDPSGELERVSVYHPDPAKVEIGRQIQARYPPRKDSGQGVWQAIRTGQASWASHISDEILERGTHDREHLAMIRSLGLRSYVSVPLWARGAAIGAITLVYAESGRHFDEADVELAMQIAQRAAVAVDNARLFEALQTADRRKDEFLAMLAHELRNPLAPISTAAELLRLVAGDNPQAQRAAGIVARQVGHMTELVDDLLDVSRVTRGLVELQREPVDLKAALVAAVEQVQALVESRRHTLHMRISPQPLVVLGDRARLIQVAVNLLNNAAKYTPAGGFIELQVEADGDGDAITMRVRDNGIGIDRALLPHVFELFTQAERTPDRSQGGLGIGLALVRSIVRLHGGAVQADSDGPGHGSTFTVTLPRLRQALADLPAPAAAAPRAAGGKRVLVVDDNIDAAAMVAEVLRLHGNAVDVAADGERALAMAAAGAPYDAFVLDIGLPDMTGYELVRRLKGFDANAHARFVALTGYGQHQDRAQALDAGFDEHLVKPADSQRLVRWLDGA